MGISPIISLVDEFALYAYHSPKYDRGFEYVSKVCSEWTDNKWVPPFMSDTSEKIGKAANLVSNTVIDG
jgi:hypothetical protein